MNFIVIILLFQLSSASLTNMNFGGSVRNGSFEYSYTDQYGFTATADWYCNTVDGSSFATFYPYCNQCWWFFYLEGDEESRVPTLRTFSQDIFVEPHSYANLKVAINTCADANHPNDRISIRLRDRNSGALLTTLTTVYSKDLYCTEDPWAYPPGAQDIQLETNAFLPYRNSVVRLSFEAYFEPQTTSHFAIDLVELNFW